MSSENLTLNRLTYISLTNWGLLISCQSFVEEKYGLEYFPYIELYTEMGLPILDGMQQLWKMDMQDRATNLKNNHIDHKVARVEEQLE